MLVSYENEKNRRQIPKTKDYLSKKEYCDYLYSYLQVISNFDEESKERYILMKDVTFTKMGRDLGVSRQTISSKFRKLEKIGLIQEEPEKERYILINLDKEFAELIPFSTLRILANTVQEKVISVFVYLLVRYRAENQSPFKFTYAQIKKYIGIGESRSTDYIVADILLVLEKLELIKYSKLTEVKNGGIKTIYQIDTMNNKIENSKDVEIKFG